MHITKTLVAILVSLAWVSISFADDPTLKIDAGKTVAKISPLFHGLMTEEINHAYDGGLYAELIQNRAFLDDAKTPAHWSTVQGDGAAARASISIRPSRSTTRSQ